MVVISEGTMRRDIELEAAIVMKYVAVAPVLDERSRRLWAAAESHAIGFGGDSLVSAATGLARDTIRSGRREIEAGVKKTGRVRGAGAGRPSVEKAQPRASVCRPNWTRGTTRPASSSRGQK